MECWNPTTEHMPGSWVSGKSVVIMASHWTKPEPSFLELRSFSSVSCALFTCAATPRKATKVLPPSEKTCFGLRLLYPSCTAYFLVPVSSHVGREWEEHHSWHSGGFCKHLETWACVHPFHLTLSDEDSAQNRVGAQISVSEYVDICFPSFPCSNTLFHPRIPVGSRN